MYEPLKYEPIISQPRPRPDKPNKIVNTFGTVLYLASMLSLLYSAPRAVEWVAGVILKFI